MKVLAINGSARKDGNTAILINRVLAELEREGFGAEMIQLAGHEVTGCKACGVCAQKRDCRCIKNDIINECIAKMLDADGIILGSPTYFADVTAEMKALIDRVGYVSRANGDILRRKVGAAVVAVRRGGSIHAFDTMNHFFQISGMIIPGSIYWNIGLGREIGEVQNDEEGMETMKELGGNMAWLLKKLK